ncbi:division plane positioning ATPase MipZ [Paeniroseomonas aquatica]|uniref:nucleotide-binding protein n=1 Tax=Paeniroseomonas aquatica TaxID=373043 RepID=UPI003622CBA1
MSMVSTKGGCGKTTLTAHLAVEAERVGAGPVAVIDADPQASLARWWNTRVAETPVFVQTTLADLPQRIAELRAASVRLVLIDTPGADVSHTRAIVRLSDLVLVPSRPSPLDLGTLGSTVEMIEAESTPLLFVLNAVTPRTRSRPRRSWPCPSMGRSGRSFISGTIMQPR